MSTDKRPLKVFLCHAHADRDSVRALYTRLTNDGVDAWLDKEKLLGGQNWRMEIRTAVEEADVVVVCHSKEFNKEGFRQREVKWALDAAMEKPEGTIFIIPARLEECEVIKSLRDWHWVDLFEDDGYEMLMRALRSRADRIGVVAQAESKLAETHEQDKRLTILQRQARSLEESGNLEGALEAYLEIENINPFVAGIEQKILELQEKIRVNQKLFDLIRSTENNKRKTINKTKLPKGGAARFAGVMSIVFFLLAIFAASRIPSLFKEISLTATSSDLITPTISSRLTDSEIPLPIQITDANGVSTVLVPEGEFVMGNNNGNEDEKPEHTVHLNSYYIDVFEVTNASYKLCVDAGVCVAPLVSSIYEDPSYAQHPVVFINWDMANSYCAWRSARLPTEAEWEKAARGTNGNLDIVNGQLGCDKANYGGCVGGTTQVGTYEDSISPYGIFDMVGNVMEWTSSSYLPYPYDLNDGREDPESSMNRVVRSSDWSDGGFGIFLSHRQVVAAATYKNYIGFRCVKDAP